MKKVCLFLLAFAGLFVSSRVYAQFATSVVAYDSGAGFAAGFTNASAALGAPTAGASVTPFAPPFSTTQIVSLGTNGSLTLQFSPPIIRNLSNPFGVDFQIFGNSFFAITNGNFSGGGITSGALGGNNTGQTRVEISGDGVNWFALNPALAPTADGIFPTDGPGDPLVPMNPALTTNDFAGLGLPGIRVLYNGSAGGSGYQLAWAQDTNGNPVNVPIARFVRVNVLSGRTEVDAVSAVRGRAIVVAEDFVNDPLTNGWKIFGATNLFQWDSTNHNLAVTWDSSQSNSYFYRPLGTTLGKADAFTVDFDIQLNSLQWTNTFQLAVGLLNFSKATNTDFSRALAYSPDIFEFNYFPDSGDGFGDPNVAASMTDDTDVITSYPNFYFIYDKQPMLLGTNYHVTLTHAAGAGFISATVFTNGQVYSTMPLFYSGSIGEFRLDTISISSYSGAGQDPAFAGSLLAHGAVDNFVVTLPELAHNLSGGFTNGVWQTKFTTYADTHYALQRSTNFTSWSDVTASVAGNGDVLLLSDTNALTDKAFYRIRSVQP
jgi:hypothetical protein